MADKTSIKDEFKAQTTVKQPDVSGFIHALGSRYQHISLAESDHRDFRKYSESLLENPSFYAGLNQTGFRKFFTEWASDAHEAFLAYANRDTAYFNVTAADEITPRIFAENVEGTLLTNPADSFNAKMTTARMIDLARKENISIIPIDDTGESEDNKKIKSIIQKIPREEFRSDLKKIPASENTDIETEIKKQMQEDLNKLSEKLKERGTTIQDIGITRKDLDYILLVHEVILLAKIHTINEDYATEAEKKSFADVRELRKKYAEYIDPIEKILDSATAKNSANQLKDRPQNLMLDLNLTDRLQVDERHWLNIIKQHSAPDEKTIFFVGAGHLGHALTNGHNVNGIDELLGGDKKVATIALAINDTEIQDHLRAEDPPHAIIDLRDNTVIVGEKLNLPGYKSGDKVKIEDFRIQPAEPSAPAQHLQNNAAP